jgi:hypothetical protein
LQVEPPCFCPGGPDLVASCLCKGRAFNQEPICTSAHLHHPLSFLLPAVPTTHRRSRCRAVCSSRNILVASFSLTGPGRGIHSSCTPSRISYPSFHISPLAVSRLSVSTSTQFLVLYGLEHPPYLTSTGAATARREIQFAQISSSVCSWAEIKTPIIRKL